jgi:hypothetical protein
MGQRGLDGAKYYEVAMNMGFFPFLSSSFLQMYTTHANPMD